MKIIKIIPIVIFFGLPMAKGQPSGNFNQSRIKKVMNDAAKWQLKNPKHELYEWTNGAFYTGVFAAWQTTGSKRLYKAMVKMGEQNGWRPGMRLHHADDYAICQTYLDLYRKDRELKMILPTIDSLNKFMSTPYPANGYKSITWWWCDALFMAPPAMIKLSVTSGSDKYINFSDKLWHETYDLLYDQEEHLFARDLRYVRGNEFTQFPAEENGEKIFWSRGNGWVMGGLVKVLQELPEHYPDRAFYLDVYKKMAAKLASIQQDDGLWRSSLLDPDSYPGGEASGSGFNIYAMAWGINQGVLDSEPYLEVVKKGWNGLNTLIQDNGKVGWVQPVGADPRKNFNADSWEVYGTGAFLLAGSEVIKLVEKGLL